MIHIKSLPHLHSDSLYSAFSQAFADYERSWTQAEFEKMLHRRGFDPSLSFGAFDGDSLVAFTFNGIGVFNGIHTAYDTGTGTVKEYRGRGLAGKIFQESLPHLKAAGIRQYLLEVLQHNSTAVKIYLDNGFRIVRELNYFIQPLDKIKLHAARMPEGIELKELHNLIPETMHSMWDFDPSWQNTFEAVSQQLHDFKIAGAFAEGELIGYGIIETASGDIPQLAVHKQFRRNGIGTAILSYLLSHNRSKVIKVINTEAANEGFTRFLEASNIGVTGKQFEMVREVG